MSWAVWLAAYGLVLAVIAPAPLAALTRRGRAPRAGYLTWSLVAATVLATWTLAVMAASADLVHPAADTGWLSSTCTNLAHRLAAHPTGRVLVAAAVATVIGAALTGFGRSGRILVRTRRAQRRHAEALRLVGRPLPGGRALVLDTAERAAYCVPGAIVVTTGAVRALESDELAAVVAHETAHLSGRHHLMLAGIRAVARAVPPFRLFPAAAEQVARLVELRADDVAARAHGRAAVAAAMARLVDAWLPHGSLAVSGTDVVQRLERLLGPTTRRSGGLAALALTAATAAMLSGPVIVVLAVPFCAG